MARTGQNLTMYQGEAQVIRAPIVDAAGAPVTLTGASITWRAENSYGAGVTKSTGAGGVTLATTVATDDTVVITLAPADTATLTPGAYAHEAAITGSQAGVLLTGVLTLLESEVL